VHLDVWNETCGGAEFMGIGMLSNWKDVIAPERLAAKKDAVRRKYSCTEEQVEAFRKLLDEELEEEKLVHVPHTPTIPQPRVYSAEERGEMA
jgi:hypothetical protein